MNRIKRAVALLTVAAFALLCACSGEVNEAQTFHGVVFPVMAYNDIIIEDGLLFTGAFPEDGSFDEKQNVVALKVFNRSDKDLQLIRIYATTDKKELFFEITTLPANMGVTVLEKNAQTLEADEKILDFRAENRVDFAQPLSLHRDKFSVVAPGGVFNITNISGSDFSGNINVYYKKRGEDGLYFGGITFRSSAGALKAGELKQIPASRFNPQDSEVMFIDYAGE